MPGPVGTGNPVPIMPVEPMTDVPLPVGYGADWTGDPETGELP